MSSNPFQEQMARMSELAGDIYSTGLHDRLKMARDRDDIRHIVSQFECMLLCKEAQTVDSRPDSITLPVHLVRELVAATHAMYEKKGAE